jgi:hypothetical protein
MGRGQTPSLPGTGWPDPSPVAAPIPSSCRDQEDRAEPLLSKCLYPGAVQGPYFPNVPSPVHLNHPVPEAEAELLRGYSVYPSAWCVIGWTRSEWATGMVTPAATMELALWIQTSRLSLSFPVWPSSVSRTPLQPGSPDPKGQLQNPGLAM